MRELSQDELQVFALAFLAFAVFLLFYAIWLKVKEDRRNRKSKL